MFFLVKVGTQISNIKALKKFRASIKLDNIQENYVLSIRKIGRQMITYEKKKQKIKQCSTYYRTRKEFTFSNGIHFLVWKCQPNHCNFIEAAKRPA